MFSARYVAVLTLLSLGLSIYADTESDVVTLKPTTLSNDDKKQCVKDLLEWCSKNEYPTGDNEMSIFAISFFDGKLLARIYCTTTSNGTDCLKAKDPWFHCYPNGTLTYKSTPLSDSNSDVDDDICETRDTAKKFSSGSGFNRNALDSELTRVLTDMQDFFREFLILQDIFDNVRKQLVHNNPTIFDVDTELHEDKPQTTTLRSVEKSRSREIDP